MQDMGNTLSTGNVLHFASHLAQQGKVAADKASGLSKIRQRELAMSLTQDLQSTLELNEIINLLLDRLQDLLPIDGIAYEHPSLGIECNTAKQGKHKASYQLDIGKENLGLISFSRRTRFTNDELTAIENLMSCLLYPLRNALKYRNVFKAATTDSLTGSGNRMALEDSLNREIQLARRDEIPLSVVMFDFDYFKSLNDTYGHQCGDVVWKRSTHEIQQMFRKTDLLFRYGGEEFVLLLHKTSLDSAAMVAEKIRERVADTVIQFKDTQLDTSISMGAASLKENDGISSLIERADKAMYQAKHNGRNQVCLEA